MKERQRGTVILPRYQRGTEQRKLFRRVTGDRNLKTGDHVCKDRSWAEVRREDTDSMELSTEPSGSMGYRDRGSHENRESARVPGKKSKRD